MIVGASDCMRRLLTVLMFLLVLFFGLLLVMVTRYFLALLQNLINHPALKLLHVLSLELLDLVATHHVRANLFILCARHD